MYNGGVSIDNTCYDYENFIKKRIYQLRTAKGVSAREMSLTIGQNVNYINGVENGRTSPSVQGLFYICDYFNITPQVFFSDTTNPAQTDKLTKKIATLSQSDLQLVTDLVDRLSRR